jgi:bifunctional DNase/RNase
VVDETPKKFVIASVASVVVELPDQFPTVTLVSQEGHKRTISFRVGLSEGAALASALSGAKGARPSSAELFAEALQRFEIDLVAVRIVEKAGTTYLAEIDLVGKAGRHVISARPSDALCLALRHNIAAPILIAEDLF